MVQLTYSYINGKRDNLDFEEALKIAQNLGYVEAMLH